MTNATTKIDKLDNVNQLLDSIFMPYPGLAFVLNEVKEITFGDSTVAILYTLPLLMNPKQPGDK